jgi:hypothetical protein
MNKYLIATPIACILMFYFLFMNYTTFTEAGIMRNEMSGETQLQGHAGWHMTAPWVLVARIDTRPAKVCITSASHAYNCKLAQFNISAWQDFVATEGFRYYWWANRISLNMGYGEEYRGFHDLLRGYAFSAKKYSFITILNEYQQQ